MNKNKPQPDAMKLDPNLRMKKAVDLVRVGTEVLPTVHGNGSGDLALPHAESAAKGNGNSKAPQAEVTASPGAFAESDNYYKVFTKEHPAVHPDRKVILAAAWNGSGEAVVRNHHEQMFNAEWSGDERVLLQVAHDLAENVRSGEAHERQLEARLTATNRYPDENGEPQEWTGWTVAELAAMLVFSLLLLAVDVNSAATTLMNSGLDAFRGHYWRAALFNLALIIGGAFIIKAFSRLLQTDASRRRYAITVGIFAALSLVCSLPLFAQTYGEWRRTRLR